MNRRAAPHRGLDTHYGDGDRERPSRTQLKTQSEELQVLGRALAGLSAEQILRTEMPDALRETIAEYRRTRTHEARRRQMQYIGKLMRSVDADPLREAVAAAALAPAQETLRQHETERWRTELIATDDALTRWLAAHPATDAQRLRSLVRAARRDTATLTCEDRQPKSARELFQFIRPHLT